MMSTMETATVIDMNRRRERGRRVARAIDVRRGLDGERRSRTRRGGRAWVNGRPLGSSGRLEYLSAVHD
jgi:hypothetical protein